MSEALVFVDGMQITLHFSIQLSDGEVVDSTWDKQPVTFTVGDGNLPSALESLLHGMQQGDSGTHCVSADVIFGPDRSEHRVWLSRSHFADATTLEVGLMMAFTGIDSSGESVGVIKSVTQDKVLVDFNHPLAGRELIFKAEILNIRSPP